MGAERMRSVVAVGVLALALSPACQRRPRGVEADADITPAAELAPGAVLEGEAVVVTYRWRTGEGFRPVQGEYGVFAHVVEEEGAMLFADDHQPEPPTSTWQAGREYSYSRILFAPHHLATRAMLRVGLFREGQRLALHGVVAGKREYAVAELTVTPRARPQFQFPGAEWSRPESYAGDIFRPLRWLVRPTGRIRVENPKAASLLLLKVHAAPALVGTWPAVRVEIGPVSWALPVRSHEFDLLKLSVPAEAWGVDEWGVVRVTVLRDAQASDSVVTEPGRALALHGIAVTPVAGAPQALSEGALAPAGVVRYQ